MYTTGADSKFLRTIIVYYYWVRKFFWETWLYPRLSTLESAIYWRPQTIWPSYNLRGHKYMLATARSSLQQDRRIFFSQQVVRPWNRAVPDHVEAPTVNTFKRRYDALKRGVHRLKPTASMSDNLQVKLISYLQLAECDRRNIRSPFIGLP